MVASLHASNQRTKRREVVLIYFLKAGSTSKYKIGYTTNIKQRITKLQIGCPDTLHLVALWNGDTRLERKIHQRYRHHRVRGEWFRLSEGEALDLVINMSDQVADRRQHDGANSARRRAGKWGDPEMIDELSIAIELVCLENGHKKDEIHALLPRTCLRKLVCDGLGKYMSAKKFAGFLRAVQHHEKFKNKLIWSNRSGYAARSEYRAMKWVGDNSDPTEKPTHMDKLYKDYAEKE